MSEAFDELVQNVQDHEDRLSNTEDSVNDHESRVASIEETVGDGSAIGQLTFPLTPDSEQIIRQLFPTGSATLVAGTVTVNDQNINAASTVIYTRSTSGGTLGHLSYTTGTGTITFTSSSNTDTSTIVYVIFQ